MQDQEPPFDPVHDVAILGTSPVLLIEGLLRARAGERVAFVEAQPDIGGVWMSTTLGEITDIESVCLLLENYRGAYGYLERTLGVPFEVMAPAPTLVTKRGSVIAYNSRFRTIAKILAAVVRIPPVALVRAIEALTLGRWRLRQTARFRFSAAFRSLGILLRHPMSGDRRVRYFFGGAPRMLREVRAELAQLGATFVRGHATELVVETDSPVIVRTRDGQAVQAREFVGGESTSLETAVIDGERYGFEPREIVHEHLVLEVAGMRADTCSYVQMPHDPVMSRFNDITPFCRGVDARSGHRVLIAQMAARDEGDEATRCRNAVQYLVDRGLLPASASLVRGRGTQVQCQAAQPSVARTLRKAGRPELTFLTTIGDLSWTVLLCRERWQRWIDRGSKRASVDAPQTEPSRNVDDVASPVEATREATVARD